MQLAEAIESKLRSLGQQIGRNDLRLFKVNLFFLCRTAN